MKSNLRLLILLGSLMLMCFAGACKSTSTVASSCFTPKIQDLLRKSEDLQNVPYGPSKAMQLDTQEIACAVQLIKSNPDYRSYHLLVALHVSALKDYENLDAAVKASVLCSSLKHAHNHNDWGMLPWGRPVTQSVAKLLVQLGTDAIPHLVPLLDDKRPAGVVATEGRSYLDKLAIRKCDYAYWFIMTILGENTKPPLFDLHARDQLIGVLKSHPSLLENTVTR